MKKVFYLLLLLPMMTFSQSYTIDYDVQLNSLERKGTLVIKENEVPFYFESFLVKESKKNEQKYDEVGTLNITVSTAFNPDHKRYQFYSKEENSLINVDYVGEEEIIVHENYPEMQWKIESETKKIANYVCNKATVTFRGREWIAWFTPELPINVGPWKFVNLPGTILQAYDKDANLSWNATKINFDTPDIQPFDLDTKKVQRVTLREFLELEDETRRQQTNKLLSRHFQRGTIQSMGSKTIRSGREVVYEWEE